MEQMRSKLIVYQHPISQDFQNPIFFKAAVLDPSLKLHNMHNYYIFVYRNKAVYSVPNR
jgi:hypothetical protein